MEDHNLTVSVKKDSDLILNSYSTTRKEVGDIERLYAALKQSDEHIKNSTLSKLDLIGQQLKFLSQQAKQILEDAATNSELHRIPCNFVKVPGKLYHLYEREKNEERFWSMIAPEEWQNNPNKYIASYRLESDRSFTPLDKIEEFASNRKFAEALLQASPKDIPALELPKASLHK